MKVFNGVVNNNGTLFVTHSDRKILVSQISAYLSAIHELLMQKITLRQFFFLKILNDLARSGCRADKLLLNEKEALYFKELYLSLPGFSSLT